MARITFSPNQPIQSLSGTICGVTYSTRANERRALYDRIRRLYNKFIDDPELRLSDNKLRTAILREYYEKR